MAPFASGPAPRWEPGSARIQFMESEPPDGIEFAVRSSSLLASTALLAARRLFLCGALLRGGLLLPGDLAAGLLRCGGLLAVRALLAAVLLRRCLLRCGLASGLLLRSGLLAAARPHRHRQRAWLFGGWGFFVTHPVGAPSRVVGCSRAVEPRPGRRSCVGCRLPRASMPHMPGSATNQPGAHQRHRDCRICDSASDVDARSTLLHLDWSAVNGPSFR